MTSGGANESYELWIHSDPVKSATVSADDTGSVSVAVTIPAGFAVGAHELTLSKGDTAVARTALAVTAVTVDPPATEPTDPAATGATVLLLAGIALLLLLGGALTLVVIRRRRA